MQIIFFRDSQEKSFAGNGFFRPHLGKFAQMKLETHFRHINLPRLGLEGPIFGQSIPIRGQTQFFQDFTTVFGFSSDMPAMANKTRTAATAKDPLRLTPYGDGLAENGFSDPISGKIWVTNNYS